MGTLDEGWDEDDDSVEINVLDQQAWQILKSGKVAAFNAFRAENPGHKPNLDGFYVDVNSHDLSGINLSEASLRDARFLGCRLVAANFMGAQLTRANLNGANLTETNFTGATMERALLCGTTCDHTLFVACRLVEADFRLALNRNSNFEGADLHNADFNGSRGFEHLIVHHGPPGK